MCTLGDIHSVGAAGCLPVRPHVTSGIVDEAEQRVLAALWAIEGLSACMWHLIVFLSAGPIEPVDARADLRAGQALLRCFKLDTQAAGTAPL